MATSVDMLFRLVGKDESASRAIEGVGKKASGFGSVLGGLGKVAAVAGTALAGAFAATKVVDFFSDGIDAAKHYSQVTSQAGQAISNLGKKTDITVAGIQDRASQLEGVALIDEEDIISAQTALTRFGITTDATLGRVTKIAANMAVGTGKSIESTSQMLGKALADPLKGASKLARAGVVLTGSSKAAYDAAVKAKDAQAAQNILLDATAKKFKNAAKAQDPLTAAQFRLSDAWGDFQRTIGQKLLPILASVTQWFADKLPGALESVGRFIQPVIDFVGRLFAGFSTGQGTVSGIATTLTGLAQTISGVFGAAWQAASDLFTRTILPVLKDLWSTLSANLGPALASIAAAWRDNIAPALTKFIAVAKPVVSALIQIQGFVVKLAIAILGKVLPPLISFIGWLAGQLIGAISTAIDWIGKIISWFVKIGQAVVDTVRFFARFVTGVKEKIGQAVEFVKSIPARIVSALGDLSKTLLNAGLSIIQGFLDGITQKFEGVKDFVGGIASWISDHKGPISKDRTLLTPHGRAIIDGFAKGMSAEFPGTMKFVKSIPTRIADAIAGGAKDVEKAMQKISDALGRRIDSMQATLDKAKQYAAGIKDAFTGMGDITSFADENGNANAANIFSGLDNAVAQAKRFSDMASRLAKAGLGKTALDQLYQAFSSNPALALQSASAVLGQGSVGIKRINDAQAELDRLGAIAGNVAAKNVQGVDIKSLQAQIDKLEAKQRVVNYVLNVKIDKTADPAQVGKTIVDSIQAFERRNGKGWRK